MVEISHHADRLRLATARVEQLAQEEATLIERQSQDSADRIQRDMEHQLAAVEARRDSIRAQLTTVGALLHDLGSAVGVPAQGLDPSMLSPEPAQSAADDAHGSDVVETTEQAFDRADETDDADARQPGPPFRRATSLEARPARSRGGHPTRPTPSTRKASRTWTR